MGKEGEVSLNMVKHGGLDRELGILAVPKFINRGRDDDIMFIENV